MRTIPIPLAPAAALVAAVLTAVVIVSVRPPTPTANAAGDDLRATVSVVGDGRVVVQPDVANVSLGVEATGQTLEAAQADASARMQAVVDTLVGLGIPRDDIRTNRLSANPVYDQKDNTVIRGYRAANSVQVKLRQLNQVGAVVDAVTAAGANRVDGISFALDQLEGPKGQARGLAMQNARTKADQLAGLAGMRIVGVKSIQEADASGTPARFQPAAASADSFSSPPPIEPGTQEVRTQVTVTYVME